MWGLYTWARDWSLVFQIRQNGSGVGHSTVSIHTLEWSSENHIFPPINSRHPDIVQVEQWRWNLSLLSVFQTWLKRVHQLCTIVPHYQERRRPALIRRCEIGFLTHNNQNQAQPKETILTTTTMPTPSRPPMVTPTVLLWVVEAFRNCQRNCGGERLWRCEEMFSTPSRPLTVTLTNLQRNSGVR